MQAIRAPNLQEKKSATPALIKGGYCMSVTVAAALKKIAVAVLTDKKLRKTVLGILLGVIVIIVMPFVAILGVLNGDVELDADRFNQIWSENMAEEKQKRFQQMDQIIEDLQIKMQKAELSEKQIKAAKTLCFTVLADMTDQEEFTRRLTDCFAPEQSDEELTENLNTAFGTQIRSEEISTMLGKESV